MKLKDALQQGTSLLEKGGVGSPRLNAEVLLMHAAHCNRAHLFSHSERDLTEVEWIHYGRYLNERLQGKPTPYITGHQEFWGLDFLVDPSVLIPRPETELVVEAALEFARARPIEVRSRLVIADVGTGSGCIAIAVAKELPAADLFALDNSATALATARKNGERLGVASRIQCLHSDLLRPNSGEPLPQLDIVVSNPPYVSTADASNVMAEVRRYEPQSAVFAGTSGIEAYVRLIPQAAAGLRPGGLLVLELGYDVEERVRGLLVPQQWDDISWRKDLAGITRVVIAQRTER